MAYCMIGVAHFMALRYLIWDQELPPEAESAAIEFVRAGLQAG